MALKIAALLKKIAKTKNPQTIAVQGFHVGAARQIRTADLILTKDALYRLSYSSKMATRKGLEPSTSGVTGRRSNQLNYRAILSIKTAKLRICLAGAEGFEPSALGFGDRCSTS